MNLKEIIKNYVPYNEQEEKDKELMLEFIDSYEDVLTRNNKLGHFSATSWVVNKDKTKVLMVYHNIFDSWSWAGGHADGEEDLLKVAIKELEEETGIKNYKLIDNNIFSLEALCVEGHIKKEKYVSSHLHLNLTYLFEADENEPIRIKEDENSGVKWIEIQKIKEEVTEKWMIENIYNKLVSKVENLVK